MRGFWLAAACIFLFISMGSAFAVTPAELAESVSKAVETAQNYRTLPKEIHERDARAMSASIQESLQYTSAEPPPVTPVSINTVNAVLGLGAAPTITATLCALAYSPSYFAGHHVVLGSLGVVNVAVFVSVVLTMQHSKYIPVLANAATYVKSAWVSARYYGPSLVTKFVNRRERRRFRKKLLKELEARAVPVDVSNELCGPILSDEPMVRVADVEEPLDLGTEPERRQEEAPQAKRMSR